MSGRTLARTHAHENRSLAKNLKNVKMKEIKSGMERKKIEECVRPNERELATQQGEHKKIIVDSHNLV